MSESVFNFDETEFPELYRLISDKIEESAKLDFEKVPEQVHLNAISGYLEDANMPVRTIGNMVRDKTPDQAELFMENIDFEISPEDIAEEYRKNAHKEDWKITGREHHDRTVDALIEDALENPVTEDYDAVFSETFFKDPDSAQQEDQYQDINLDNCRQFADMKASDADFWKVKLEDQRIELIEVKTRQNQETETENRQNERVHEVKNHISGNQNRKDFWDAETESDIDNESLGSRANQENKGDYPFEPDYNRSSDELSKAEEQRKHFEEAVEYANEVAGTEFTVESSTVYATNTIYTENIVPNVYEGEAHVSGEVEEEKLSELEDFMDELLYGMDFQDADELRRSKPEEYAES